MTDPWIVDAEFEVITPARDAPRELTGTVWGAPLEFPPPDRGHKRNKRFKGAPDGWIPEHLREPMWKRTARLWTWGIGFGTLAIIVIGDLVLRAGAYLGLWLYSS
jgi:hypothetical protein